jgi:xylulokinase
MYLLGYDIGSSSVKAALVDARSGDTIAIAQHPDTEMRIAAPQPDWAEQNPADWWQAACLATQKLLAKAGVPARDIQGIGISYQMHGLVLVDVSGNVLRPAIIWCDSRAVTIGDQAFTTIGAQYCLEHYLNSPGNFTASKLRWVQQYEPAVFDRIHKIMLPGDYMAYRMTGDMCTTVTGLSEGIFWDFAQHDLAHNLLDYYQIPSGLLPDLVPVFGKQGVLSAHAAQELGLPAGIPVGYRAGDQPNNALSLHVLRPGEVAATGGTSGVVYAVAEKPCYDPQRRVNSFAHVNYTPENPLTGVLLCINGAGSAYRWVRDAFGGGVIPYIELEKKAAAVAIGAEGLTALPFGNGAERMLGNQNPGATFSGIQFNRHESPHFYRATLEGIAFAFVAGAAAIRQMDIPVRVLRVGNDNLFQSAIFAQTIATLLDVRIEMMATTGAAGAARAAGVGAGLYDSIEAAMAQPKLVHQYEPDNNRAAYAGAYERWQGLLRSLLPIG